MARSINRLSARTVETIAKPGRHADGGNLFLIVDAARENGSPRKPARRWAFIFRWDGKLKEMGLGSLNAISLARARELAGQYRTVLAENRNPIEVRRAEERKRVAGRTFGEVATELHSSLQSGWRGVKYRRQWLPTLRTYAAGIWERPVAEVETAHVLAILEPIWTTKAETAGKVRERIEAVLDAARARGLIPEDRANPARWRGHLVHLLAKRPKLQRGHHAALPFAEVSAFMSELREREAMAALCLQFVVLTCARSAERSMYRYFTPLGATSDWP